MEASDLFGEAETGEPSAGLLLLSATSLVLGN